MTVEPGSAVTAAATVVTGATVEGSDFESLEQPAMTTATSTAGNTHRERPMPPAFALPINRAPLAKAARLPIRAARYKSLRPGTVPRCRCP